jgi:hypothetical protein
MLQMTEAGYADAISPDPRRRRPGLMNLFTYGRSVTMAMLTMKRLDDRFAEWWAPFQAKMTNDPLMSYFNTKRTDVVHEEDLQVSTSTYISHLDSGMIEELNRHAPPGTIGTFFGEGTTGGMGGKSRCQTEAPRRCTFRSPTTLVPRLLFTCPTRPLSTTVSR